MSMPTYFYKMRRNGISFPEPCTLAEGEAVAHVVAQCPFQGSVAERERPQLDDSYQITFLPYAACVSSVKLLGPSVTCKVLSLVFQAVYYRLLGSSASLGRWRN